MKEPNNQALRAREVLAAAFLARGFATEARGCDNGSVDPLLLAMLGAMQTFAAAEGRMPDREAMVRAMYDAWPHTVISQALSEVFGLPVGTVLTYELARAGRADFKGLERFADAIANLQPATPTDRHMEGRLAGLEEAARRGDQQQVSCQYEADSRLPGDPHLYQWERAAEEFGMFAAQLRSAIAKAGQSSPVASNLEGQNS